MTSIIERTDMKEYTCKYCHKTFSFEDGKKASGFMSAHQRFCEANPKRQWYLEKIRESSKAASRKLVSVLAERYQQSLQEYHFVCEKCGKEYTKILSPKQYNSYLKHHHFCSVSCAHSRVHTTESRNKVSLSLRKRYESKIIQKYHIKKENQKQFGYHPTSCQLRQTKCIECGVDLFVKTTAEVYCHNCIKNHPDYHHYCLYDKDGHKVISDETKKKLLERARESVANGTHKGWCSRNITSYPEMFWQKVLENNGIEYQLNFPITKKSLGLDCNACYFLDFKLEPNIDLEIDGRQHEDPERKEHDRFRDDVLTSNGWVVYRICWNEINSEDGKQTMKKKIDDFISWYRSQTLI